MTKGKKILLGVCGSIAAYKSAYLVRLLVKSGSEVKVVMTEAATSFISPLTLSTLSKHKVDIEFVEDQQWNNHVELGLWGDAMIIAPASAHSIAKMANGLCDNLLTATYLSAKCPVIIAPAMDLDMWKHPATQANITQVSDYGVSVISVNNGELASGLIGEGRMAEPEEIKDYIDKFFAEKKSPITKNKSAFFGKKVLITAGPTVESIDPVRFISNHSTGKMGIAIAETLAQLGAEVFLVKGPTAEKVSNHTIKTIEVQSAEEMYQECTKIFPETDISILAAAVADYTPDVPASEKIKKHNADLTLKLRKTKDILKHLGETKAANQIIVGFALETNNELAHARQKLESKNLDMIVLNSLKEDGAGFGYDTNKITVIHRDGEQKEFELKKKKEVAIDIVTEIELILNEK